MSDLIRRAFILGAGLGTRLKSLTKNFPKPLLPIQGRPIVTYALDHLKEIGVKKVIINTHHAAAKWEETFPKKEYKGIPLEFRYEPHLLGTGGGLKNVEDFFKDHGTFVIYNGDILTHLPLEKAVAHHHNHQNMVTMILRSHANPKHVALNSEGQVMDIGNTLGNHLQKQYLFTGIHIVEPDIFRHIPELKIQSIISIYLDLIRQGMRIGGIVLDQGEWSDVGTPEELRIKN